MSSMTLQYDSTAINIGKMEEIQIENTSASEAEASCCARVNQIFQNLHRYCYAHTPRVGRNIFRVVLAGGLSFAGGATGGDPRIVAAIGVLWAIYLGAILSGLGNALSTYLFLETDMEDRVPLLEKQVGAMGIEIQDLKTRFYQMDPKLFNKV